MKCCVNVPLNRELEFPDRCPFSDAPSPKGTVCLKRKSTSLVMPLPGGFQNSYSATSLEIPAQRTVAVMAVGLEMAMWLSMLGGMLIAVLLVNADGPLARFAAFFVLGGLVAAVGCRIARWIVLRRVRIGNAWEGYVEVRFDSESYAKEFSEMNRLALAN
jgi:hypothetical protein